MNRKVCKKCGEEKPLSEFRKHKQMKDGHKNQCKSCVKEQKKKWAEDNKEKFKEYQKEWYQDNKEKRNEYRKNRRKTDPIYRLSHNIRAMVHRAIKTKRTEEIIGCSFKHLKLHLENQFTEGMSWDNYGQFGWQIDHKKPLSWFDLSNPDEVAKANNYKNLQPMWAEENLSKGNRFEVSSHSIFLNK